MPVRRDHLAGGGRDHGEHEQAEHGISDLVQEPSRAQQCAKETPVIEAPRQPGKLEAQCAGDAEQDRRDQHAREPAQGPGTQEEFDEFAPGGIAAPDNDRLQQQAGQNHPVEQ